MCLFDSLDLFSQDFPTPVSGGKREKRESVCTGIFRPQSWDKLLREHNGIEFCSLSYSQS